MMSKEERKKMFIYPLLLKPTAMNDLKYGIGIDVSKEKFDVCLSLIDTAQKVTVTSSSSFANNLKGFTAFHSWCAAKQQQPLPTVYLMEATGIYHEQLAWFLFEQQCNVVVMLPNKARKYKESLGLKSKTDSMDAKGLSRMACEQCLTRWQPASKKDISNSYHHPAGRSGGRADYRCSESMACFISRHVPGKSDQ